jgi:hypothetical protein
MLLQWMMLHSGFVTLRGAACSRTGDQSDVTLVVWWWRHSAARLAYVIMAGLCEHYVIRASL